MLLQLKIVRDSNGFYSRYVPTYLTIPLTCRNSTVRNMILYRGRSFRGKLLLR
jgi:hypothetical protein